MTLRARPSLASLAAFALAASAGCALRPPPARAPSRRQAFTSTVSLHGHGLALHLSAPPAAVTTPVVVMYASGDGGWFGAAPDMFRRIAAAGYFAVGFSSRAFLRIDRPRGAAINPPELAAEYAAILAEGRRALGLPGATPVILTGWSRGAAFAVLAGAEPALQPQLLGVLAIGLAKDEDLAVNAAGDDDDAPPASGGARFDTYARLARLGRLRCAVVQATHDHYLPAAQAREHFGPDGDLRRFYAVNASNHRFSGGKEALGAAIADALAWITHGAG